MLEVGRRLIGEKTLAADDRRELRLEHFESDLPRVLQVFGQIDRGHPALPELALDSVAAIELRVHARCGLVQKRASLE